MNGNDGQFHPTSGKRPWRVGRHLWRTLYPRRALRPVCAAGPPLGERDYGLGCEVVSRTEMCAGVFDLLSGIAVRSGTLVCGPASLVVRRSRLSEEPNHLSEGIHGQRLGAEMDLEGADDSESRFAAYVEGLVSVIGRADRAAPLRDYCLGLVMPGERTRYRCRLPIAMQACRCAIGSIFRKNGRGMPRAGAKRVCLRRSRSKPNRRSRSIRSAGPVRPVYHAAPSCWTPAMATTRACGWRSPSWD